MKLLGIDYGRRRIGIAVTDHSGSCIRGLTTVDRQKQGDVIDRLINIIKTEKPTMLIFGLPLSIADDETAMSTEVRQFAATMSARSSLPIEFVDESFSSSQAAGLVSFRKKKERRDKGLRDRIAACLIIESYQRLNPTPTQSAP
jgi:putative Holliday junction resolvase